jgi:hypothetical protein
LIDLGLGVIKKPTVVDERRWISGPGRGYLAVANAKVREREVEGTVRWAGRLCSEGPLGIPNSVRMAVESYVGADECEGLDGKLTG